MASIWHTECRPDEYLASVILCRSVIRSRLASVILCVSVGDIQIRQKMGIAESGLLNQWKAAWILSPLISSWSFFIARLQLIRLKEPEWALRIRREPIARWPLIDQPWNAFISSWISLSERHLEKRPESVWLREAFEEVRKGDRQNYSSVLAEREGDIDLPRGVLILMSL